MELTCWLGEYDPDAAAADQDHHLGALWETAAVAGACAEQVTGANLADRPRPVALTGAAAKRFFRHRAWRVSRRRLVLGRTQDDIDLPVRVVAVVS